MASSIDFLSNAAKVYGKDRKDPIKIYVDENGNIEVNLNNCLYSGPTLDLCVKSMQYCFADLFLSYVDEQNKKERQ